MKTTKKTLLIALAIAVPVCLGGGYRLAKRVLWPRYKEYRAASFERSAREFLDKGDYENAMLFVRNPTGVSHAPEESAEPADIDAGVAALTRVIEELA